MMPRELIAYKSYYAILCWRFVLVQYVINSQS